MSIRIDRTKLICAIVGAGLLVGCASTTPPALPPGNQPIQQSASQCGADNSARATMKDNSREKKRN